MQTALATFGADLASIKDIGTVHHYWHPVQSSPFTIWAEQRETNTFYADNGKAEMVIEISVDYWTKVEYDPIVDDIQSFFSSNHYLWNLDSILYENETNLIHWSWTVEMSVAPEVSE